MFHHNIDVNSYFYIFHQMPMWSSSKVMIRDLFCTVYVSGLARSLMLGPSSMAAQMEQG